jgi:hypothetical protein
MTQSPTEEQIREVWDRERTAMMPMLREHGYCRWVWEMRPVHVAITDHGLEPAFSGSVLEFRLEDRRVICRGVVLEVLS